jgi:hypothetical protein
MSGGRVGVPRKRGVLGANVSLPLAEHPPVSTRWHHHCYSLHERTTQLVYLSIWLHCHLVTTMRNLHLPQNMEETFICHLTGLRTSCSALRSMGLCVSSEYTSKED